MTEENTKNINASVARINAMTDEELDALIAEDKCPYEPEHLKELALGMFHCPLCEEMIMGGLPHIRYSKIEEPTDDEGLS